ncbi:endonuclease domain-containing protein [Williamsia soli]|uniref:endonuclease domain-containing protein n=1 Tax=Williamsia soli TaxID=364929 RepID=UPI001A9DD6A5|nr:DUF559 domain-containing protein [Williamsia soli]
MTNRGDIAGEYVFLMDWSALPASGVVSLKGVGAAAIALALDDLPDDAPAVLLTRIDQVSGASQVIDELIGRLERTAYDLYPAWLPGAEVTPGRSTIDRVAARSLAATMAASTPHHRPFLMDLAANAVAAHSGGESSELSLKYSSAGLMAGLVRVISESFVRDAVVFALYPAAVFTAAQQEQLAATCDWLATYVGVWLLDDITSPLDRFPIQSLEPGDAPVADEQTWTLPTLTYPPLAGRPHPASTAEGKLEAHLARQHWAGSRRWNQTVPTGDLSPYVRADLVWPEACLVVEIDGADHRTAAKYADDRRRDVALQLAGYTVVRFTNEQVLSDTPRVADIIEKLRSDRLAAKELP